MRTGLSIQRTRRLMANYLRFHSQHWRSNIVNTRKTGATISMTLANIYNPSIEYVPSVGGGGVFPAIRLLNL